MKKLGRSIVPVLASAAASAALMQIGGIFTLICLVPIGVVAFSRGVKSAWASVLSASLIHGFVLFVILVIRPLNLPYSAVTTAFIWNCASMILILCVFAWVVAPPIPIPSTAFRFIIGGAIVCGLFMVGFDAVSNIDGLYASITAQINALDKDLGLGDQWDVASMTRNVLAATARGGGLAMAVLFLFANRQIGMAISAIAGKKKTSSGDMVHFFAPPVLVWVLSFSLLAVIVFTRFIPVQPLEIAAWNVVMMCALLYTAQGLGVVTYFLSIPRRSVWFKMAMTFLIVVMVMSPGINAVAIGVVLLLGIAENWVTFRNFDKTSSTPVM